MIYYYATERNRVISLFKKQITHMIPVLGAGFTMGENAFAGKVPSGDELKEEMISLLSPIVRDTDKVRLKAMNLPGVSNYFMHKYSNLRMKFMKYVNNHFIGVRDLTQSKVEFLQSGWNRIYTLNYDDAIEQQLPDYHVLYPYDEHNVDLIENEPCILKIHGDANRYYVTGDSKYFIIRHNDYIKALKDERNSMMLHSLKNDFFSKTILFIGCGLNDEMELMFAADAELGDITNKNLEKIIIYVYCGENTLSDIDEVRLRDYGVSHIIMVRDAHAMLDLYHEISMLNRIKAYPEDGIGLFSGIRIMRLGDTDLANLDYMYMSTGGYKENKTVKLPSFLVYREFVKELKKELDRSVRKTLYFLAGNRIGGKTFCLLSLLEQFVRTQVYYISSDIELDDKNIIQLLKQENAYILIDEGALTPEQIERHILRQITQIKNKNITIIIAINKSEIDFLNSLWENLENIKSEVEIKTLSNKFYEKKDVDDFNQRISALSMINLQKQDTFLDYLLRVADSSIKKFNIHNKLPVHILKCHDKKKIKALIVLAVEKRITSRRAIELSIDEQLYEFCKEYPLAVQKEHLLRIEKDKESGFKFMLNSAYWVTSCLINLVEQKDGKESLSHAYYDIFVSYRKLYPKDRDFYKVTKRYYFLDYLQQLLFKAHYGGSLELPNLLYSKIHPLMAENYQFLHQEAKCKLRMARGERKVEKKNEILEMAYLNINRAYELAATYEGIKLNIEYTMHHMLLTKALILTNYIFLQIKSNNMSDELIRYIEDSISIYYNIFYQQKALKNKYNRHSINDIKKFIEIMSEQINLLDKEKKKQFELFLSEFREISIEWN